MTKYHWRVASNFYIADSFLERIWPLRVVLRKRLVCVVILHPARHFEVDNSVVGENLSIVD